MSIPPIIFPAKRRVHRKRRLAASPPPGPVLVQAVYPIEGVAGAIDLKFDRAINIDAVDGTQIIVKDGLITGFINDGSGGAEMPDEQTVRFFLVGLEEYETPNQLLSAT